MKTLLCFLMLFIGANLLAQDSLEEKSDSSKIKLAQKQLLPIKQGTLLSMQAQNNLHLKSMFPEYHVQYKTTRPSIRKEKVGFPLYIVRPKINDNMPVAVPDSSVHYHLKIVGEGK